METNKTLTPTTPPAGWVIKNQKGEYLWVTTEGAFAWTAQPKWALRLHRQQDAQMLSVANKHVQYIGAQAAIEEGPEVSPDEELDPQAVAQQYGRAE